MNLLTYFITWSTKLDWNKFLFALGSVYTGNMKKLQSQMKPGHSPSKGFLPELQLIKNLCLQMSVYSLSASLALQVYMVKQSKVDTRQLFSHHIWLAMLTIPPKKKVHRMTIKRTIQSQMCIIPLTLPDYLMYWSKHNPFLMDSMIPPHIHY